MTPNEYFRDLYLHEQTRRDSFNPGITFSTGLMGAIGGASLGLARDIKWPLDGYGFVVAASLLVCFALLLWAGGEIWLVAINKGYAYPAFAGDAKKHLEAIRDWKATTQGGVSGDEEFMAAVVDEWIRCAHHNGQLNDGRSLHQHRSRQALLLSLVPLAIAGLVPLVDSAIF